MRTDRHGPMEGVSGPERETVCGGEVGAAPIRVLGLLGALLVLGSLGWLLLRGDSQDSPSAEDTTAGASHSDRPAAAMGASSAAQETDDPVAARTLIEPEREGTAVVDRATRLVGRCVDQDGAPLRCTLNLSSVRPRAGVDVRVRYSDAEGGFALEVPPNVPIELWLRAPGRASRSAPISRVEAGATLDLGTIVLPPGRRVVGTVRDRAGAALEGVLVALHREPKGSEMRQRTRALRVVQARSDASGGLTFDDPIQPGPWRVMASRLFEPTKVMKIVGGAHELVLDVRVENADAPAEIAGTVLDETGRPVARALVCAIEAPDLAASGAVPSPSAPSLFGLAASKVLARAETAVDGGFVLRRGKSARPVQLMIEAQGYESERDLRVRTWGEKGVQIFLRPSAAIAVRVTNRQGQPIEAFGLHVFPPRPPDLTTLRSRSRGRHLEGVAYAHGVLPGAQVVLVDGSVGGLVQDGLMRIEHHGASARFDVVLDRAVRRRLRVLNRDSGPVVAAVVELMVPTTVAPITRDTPAAKLMDLWRCRGDRALRVLSELTSSAGEVDLDGHPETRYALRVKSLNHACYFGEIVLGNSPALTEVRLPNGGDVRGRLQPAQFVEQIKLSGRPLRVALVSARADGSGERVESWGPVGADGAFAFAHVDPGDWRVEVSWTTRSVPMVDFDRIEAGQVSVIGAGAKPTKFVHDGPARAAKRTLRRPKPAEEPHWTGTKQVKHDVVVADVLGLREGEVRDVLARVDHLMLATLRGRVDVGNAHEVVRAYLVPVGDGKGLEASLALDETGGFWVYAEPGTYTCEIVGAHRGRVRACATEITLTPGQAAEVTFAIDTVDVAFSVVSDKGEPAKGVVLRVQSPAGELAPALDLAASDDQGNVRATLRPGAYEVEVDGRPVAKFTVDRPLKEAIRVVLSER